MTIAVGLPFLPHGYCFLWQANLLWLNVASDAAIALAYYSIPLSIFQLVRRRAEFGYNWILALFGSFIVLCGTTHVLDIINVWVPMYWASAYVKAATAVVSVATAALLLPLLPRLVRIPNPNIDSLTQLPNRVLFVDRVVNALARGKRFGNACAVLFMDLDGFKGVNDTYGHAAGDELLVDVARRLGRTMRASDTVARMSGDEFVILLERVDSTMLAMAAAERAIAEMQRPFVLSSGTSLSISASVGVALGSGDCEANELIARADRAMYRAKARRRGCYQLSDESASTKMAVAG